MSLEHCNALPKRPGAPTFSKPEKYKVAMNGVPVGNLKGVRWCIMNAIINSHFILSLDVIQVQLMAKFSGISLSTS